MCTNARKEAEGLYPDTDEKSKTQQTDGETYHVLGLENQYYDCTTQSNLQIQCNLYLITNGIFHRTKTKIL